MVPGTESFRTPFLLAGAVSVLAWALLSWLAPGPSITWTGAMKAAAERAARAQELLATHCAGEGIEVSPGLDPAGTCLIGPEMTPLFTSLGNLESKRTSLNPDFAALLVHLLGEAGVGPGDAVAVGASGSFPALLVASLVAVEALGARPVPILSLGASGYGATRPELHLLDIHRILLEAGIVTTPPAAVTLGGEGDMGEQFDPMFREALIQELTASPLLFFAQPDLAANVARRMEIYCGVGPPPETVETSSGPACPVAAFINVGGAEANLGTDARILSVPPGLNEDLADRMTPPPPASRGVLFEMAARGVPVVHLLNLRGLALRYGLPWDPQRRLPPRAGELRDTTRGKGWAFWLLTVAYVAGLGLVVFSRPPMRQPG